MCYTSFIWHASTTVVGANIDYGAMYLMLITLTGLGVMRTCAFIDESQRRLKAAAVALCYVVAGVTMFAMKTKLKGQTYIIVGLILTVGASFTVSSLGALALRRASPRTNPVFGLLSFLSVGLAYLLRTMDKKLLCDKFGPDSFLQGHALWHALSASAVFFAYLLLRSEDYNDDKRREWVQRDPGAGLEMGDKENKAVIAMEEGAKV